MHRLLLLLKTPFDLVSRLQADGLAVRCRRFAQGSVSSRSGHAWHWLRVRQGCTAGPQAAGAMLSELLRSEEGFKPVLGITAKGSAGLVDAQRIAGAALEAFELSLKVRSHQAHMWWLVYARRVAGAEVFELSLNTLL